MPSFGENVQSAKGGPSEPSNTFAKDLRLFAKAEYLPAAVATERDWGSGPLSSRQRRLGGLDGDGCLQLGRDPGTALFLPPVAFRVAAQGI